MTIERLGQVLLPPGAVRDGEIVDGDAVTEAIRVLWSQYGFKGKKVALGVANQQVVVRQLDLPYLPEDELRESLPFQVQDYIPIPIEQATLDCSVLEHFENADRRPLQPVLVVAAQTRHGQHPPRRGPRREARAGALDLDAFAMLRSLAPEDVVGDRGASCHRHRLVGHEHRRPRAGHPPLRARPAHGR
jgi:type IV pilus assembly protein PilM